LQAGGGRNRCPLLSKPNISRFADTKWYREAEHYFKWIRSLRTRSPVLTPISFPANTNIAPSRAASAIICRRRRRRPLRERSSTSREVEKCQGTAVCYLVRGQYYPHTVTSRQRASSPWKRLPCTWLRSIGSPATPWPRRHTFGKSHSARSPCGLDRKQLAEWRSRDA
jgi:hypothetical protein